MRKVPHKIPSSVVHHADPLIILVTAHLHLESLIIGFIDHALMKPKALDVARLSFPMKVDLAIALGSFPEHVKSAALTINRIRNRFAHEIDATIGAEDVRQLLEETPFLKPTADDNWSTLPPGNQIGWIAALLQAYLFGIFEAVRNPGTFEDEGALHARALELYPDSDSTEGDSDDA
jgi:hypothetical protein